MLSVSSDSPTPGLSMITIPCFDSEMKDSESWYSLVLITKMLLQFRLGHTDRLLQVASYYFCYGKKREITSVSER